MKLMFITILIAVIGFVLLKLTIPIMNFESPFMNLFAKSKQHTMDHVA